MSWQELFKDTFIAHVVLNIVVSLFLVRNDGLTPRQKIGQMLIVWLVPILGSLLIGIFFWTQRGSAPATGYPKDPSFGPPRMWDNNPPPPPSISG